MAKKLRCVFLYYILSVFVAVFYPDLYLRTSIFFYLPEWEVGCSTWATVFGLHDNLSTNQLAVSQVADWLTCGLLNCEF